ncbi:MAG: phosphoribosyltransferase [Bacteroidetes bacterium]|nr:phosphoribosyltransferase [Bacteroidota bacterium]
MPVKILDNPSCQSRILRMAYQLYEYAYAHEALVLIGIDQRGRHIARLLQAHLQRISPFQVHLLEVARGGTLSPSEAEIRLMHQYPVILVDDVLYTGTTLMHSLADVLQHGPQSVHIAVLIDRGHHRYPLKADFVGRELATTLQEYITVTIDEATGEIDAFLD